MNNLTRDQYLSGKVRRWHTHHSLHQTNADHQWGCAVILMKIHPNPSLDLIKYALLHDAGEYLTGDMPTYAKDSSDSLRSELAWAEELASATLGLVPPEISFEDRCWVNLADALEAWMFISHCGRFSQQEVERYFPALLAKIERQCSLLGLKAHALTGVIS